MSNELLCNFKKCRKSVNTEAWITACSHVFCSQHGTQEFAKGFVCPACETPLPGKYDAVIVDLNPSEQYKSMVLAGHRPDVVLDICARAIAFWVYQVHQEAVYQQCIYKKEKERQGHIKNYYENVIQKTSSELEQVRGELNGTKKELEVVQKVIAELTEKLAEQSREFFKLQRINDALQHKFLTPQYFEKLSSAKRKNVPNTIGITSANDIISCQNTTKAKCSFDSESERSFKLRPALTPVIRSTGDHSLNGLGGGTSRF